MAKKAILLTNLGSPDSYETRDVKNYLGEFLMDGNVIDIPYLLRLLLVKGIIVPFRAPKSAKKYKTIWTENGSPLVHITNELAKLVASHTGLPTYVCMRYANPTPDATLKKIQQENPDLQELVMLPLYPHYAMSSFGTAVDHVKQAYQLGKYGFALNVVKPFYDHSDYIASLSSSIEPFLQREYDHILFSYHGVPERHILKSDITKSHCLQSESCCSTPSPAHEFCYRHQVIETTKKVVQKLNIPPNKYSFSFQSRLGRDKWLKPFTAGLLQEFPEKGVKKLLIACPAFVSDCLETLEEIQMEGKEIFMRAGGISFEMIPCLNDRPDWVQTIGVLTQNIS